MKRSGMPGWRSRISRRFIRATLASAAGVLVLGFPLPAPHAGEGAQTLRQAAPPNATGRPEGRPVQRIARETGSVRRGSLRERREGRVGLGAAQEVEGHLQRL